MIFPWIFRFLRDNRNTFFLIGQVYVLVLGVIGLYNLVKATVNSVEALPDFVFKLLVTYPLNGAVHLLVMLYNTTLTPEPVVVVVEKPPEPKTMAVLFFEYVENFTFPVEYVLWTMGAICCFIAIAYMARRILRRLGYAVMRLRGVQFEAMRGGSLFQIAKTPRGQVAIMTPGLLVDSHVGYGIRVGDVLVVPTHVISGLRDALLSYGGIKVVLSLNSFQNSKAIPDVTYVYLREEVWAKLQCPKASIYSKVFNKGMFAVCTGIEGASTGMMNKSSSIGMLTYGGSTVPGMSGAGYCVANVFYGMHTGVVLNTNIGVSMALIAMELKKMVSGEASHDFSEQHYHDEDLARKVKQWTTENLQGAVDRSWLDDEEIDWNADLDFGESKKNESKKKKEAQAKLIGEAVGFATNVKLQGATGVEAVYRTTVEDVRFEGLERRVRAIEAKTGNIPDDGLPCERCDECNMVVFGISLEQHKKIHTKHICMQCSVVCGSQGALKAHVVSAHPQKFECLFDGCGMICRTQDKLDNHKKEHEVKVKYPCDRCSMVCTTEEKLSNHRTHDCVGLKTISEPVPSTSKVQGESAFSVDNRKIVKTDSFLGQRSKKRKETIRKSSSPSSHVRGKSNPSRSQEAILSQILESQKAIAVSLETLAKAMPGQSLVTQPK